MAGTYYSSVDALAALHDREGRQLGFDVEQAAGFPVWKEALRSRLRALTGMDGMEPVDLQPRVLESKRLEDYRREKVLIQTEQDVWMPFYVLVPDDLKPGERRACMIATHGHAIGGKLGVVGVTEIPGVAERIAEFGCDYGLQFVKAGYVVFCPDARGFGERRESTKQGEDPALLFSSTCAQLQHMALGVGRTVTGMWVWDLMRLIDYVESRPDCDASRIGCAGLSGGGLQALWLAALDERVRCAVVSGYFYGVRDALLKLPNCACNYVPGLWCAVDMGDLGALVAPRPLLIETGDKDPLNGERGLVNVTEQVDISRGAYRMLHAESQLKHHVFKGAHRWDGTVTHDFVRAALVG